MFWNASTMNGYAIAGRDGQLGTLADVLFDDSDWTIRWFIIDTGKFLPGREVCLPASAFRRPDPKEWLPVDLTAEQIRKSPALDKSKPIGRQTETELYDYYGWKPYWTDQAPSKADPPRLRSLGATTRSRVEGIDGEIGYIQDFILSDENWKINFIKIYTSDWWHGHVVILPEQIRAIDWQEKRIRLNISRETLKNSPPYNPEMTQDDLFKQTHLSYYGLSVES